MKKIFGGSFPLKVIHKYRENPLFLMELRRYLSVFILTSILFVMNRYSLITEAQLKKWVEDLKVLHQNLLQQQLPLDKEHFLTEQQVCDTLGISTRTMHTYRKKKRFHYMKIEGLILYHKLFFYLDVIRMHYLHDDETGG